MNVRLATVDDSRGIAEVHVRAWQAAYVGLVRQAVLDALSVADRDARWRSILAQSGQRTFVAEEQGLIRGFANFGPGRDDDAEIWQREMYALYVSPECWGRGIGGALWNTFDDECRAAGAREQLVWVLAENTRACRFYERLGAVAYGHRREVSIGGDAYDEVRYRRAPHSRPTDRT